MKGSGWSGVGPEQGYEDEVLYARLPRGLDEVAVAVQVHALRVVRTPAHGGVGRGDHRLDVFQGGIQ
jgi:hypothetical protein